MCTTNKKSISSTELSRKLALRQKTAWLFQRKVKEAMKSSGNNPLKSTVVVDELVVGQQEEGVFENPMKRMVLSKPMTYKMIIS